MEKLTTQNNRNNDDTWESDQELRRTVTQEIERLLQTDPIAALDYIKKQLKS